MSKKISPLWAALEEICIDPGNIYEALQAYQTECLNDLVVKRPEDEVDFLTIMARDATVVLNQLLTDIENGAREAPED